jgi:hypothetical protein
MEDLLNLAIEDLGEKWISYTKTTRFKNAVSLSENIDIFYTTIISLNPRSTNIKYNSIL